MYKTAVNLNNPFRVMLVYLVLSITSQLQSLTALINANNE